MFTQKDQLKLEIIIKLNAGLITTSLACKILKKSYRTILRYKKSYIKNGSAFLIHGNRGRTSYNNTNSEIKNKILNLISQKYFDYSVKYAWEKLEFELDENGNTLQVTSYKTLLRWCHKKNYIKKFKRKRKVFKARVRMPQTGMMLQMDGSFHKWFGNKKSCLIAAIDDANNEISYAEFFNQETTLDCMKVIQKIIETRGTFDVLYTDYAGVYGGNKRNGFCQLEEACKELGITIIYASTPQAKGRIERLWSTLQGRLVPDMRLAGIQTKKQANTFLQKIFIPKQYNKNFLVEPKMNTTCYKQNNRDNLNEIFSVKEHRTINADQTFNYNNKKYLINNFPGSLKNKLIEIRTYQDRSFKFFWANQEMEVILFENRKKAA